jgi:hypothetical protein
MNITSLMAAMHPTMPMMHPVPYQVLYHVSQQFGPNPSFTVSPATSVPQHGTMMMPYYCMQYQQPPPFWPLGADNGKNKINTNVNFTLPHLVPANNYAFAASALLKTISTDADTIKWWAILDSSATSHFLMTDMPSTNIAPTTKPIIARLPNGKRVHSTHTCTFSIPSLPPRACATHIIPGLASHSLLYVMNYAMQGALSTSPKLDVQSFIVAVSLSAVTNAQGRASGWSLSPKIQTLQHPTPNLLSPWQPT